MKLILLEGPHAPSLMEAEIGEEVLERSYSIHVLYTIYFSHEDNKKL